MIISGPLNIEVSIIWYWDVSHVVIRCQSCNNKISITWYWVVSHVTMRYRPCGDEVSIIWRWGIGMTLIDLLTLKQTKANWATYVVKIYYEPIWSSALSRCNESHVLLTLDDRFDHVWFFLRHSFPLNMLSLSSLSNKYKAHLDNMDDRINTEYVSMTHVVKVAQNVS